MPTSVPKTAEDLAAIRRLVERTQAGHKIGELQACHQEGNSGLVCVTDNCLCKGEVSDMRKWMRGVFAAVALGGYTAAWYWAGWFDGIAHRGH